jgi:acyl carrier protein
VRNCAELLRGLSAFLEAPGSPEAASTPMFTGDTEENQGIGDLLTSEAVRQVLINERDLEKLALYWTRGGEISWDVLHEGEQPRLITLPTYPFARQRYWLAASAEEPHLAQTVEPTPEPEIPAGTGRERARAFLLHFLSRELSLTPDQVRPHRDLRDHGADSITAMRLRRAVEEEFQVHITGRDLLEHRTIHALSTYLAARIDEAQAAGTGDVSPAPGAFLPPPPADRGRYFMRIASEPPPSPLMGEGSGGGEASASSPHPNLPPHRGKGYVPPPVSLPPREGTNKLHQKEGERELKPVQPAAPDALDQFKQGILTLEDMEALFDQGEMV